MGDNFTKNMKEKYINNQKEISEGMPSSVLLYFGNSVISAFF
jgi:hypothetical protein